MSNSQWDNIHDKLIKDAEKTINQHSRHKETYDSPDDIPTHQKKCSSRVNFLILLLIIVSILGLAVLFLTFYGPLPSIQYVFDTPKDTSNHHDSAFEKSENAQTSPEETQAYDDEMVNHKSAQSSQNEKEKIFKLGMELVEKGRLYEAAVYLKIALEKGNQDARLPLARALRDLKKAECLPYYIAEVKLASKDTSLLYEAARVMFDFGDSGQAMIYVQKIIDLDPHFLDGLILGSTIAQSQEQWELASEYLKKILSLSPTLIDFRKQLAEILLMQNDLKGALGEYEKLEKFIENRDERKVVKAKIKEIKELIGDRAVEEVSDNTHTEDTPDITDTDDLNETDEESPDSDAIALTRRGEHFFVPVILNDAYEANLAIDTGATITSVAPELVSQLGINVYALTEYTKLFTANGIVDAPIAYIPKIQIGKYYIENFRVAILHSFSGSDTIGLLGMNFLNNFRFSIDTVEGVLILEVIE